RRRTGCPRSGGSVPQAEGKSRTPGRGPAGLRRRRARMHPSRDFPSACGTEPRSEEHTSELQSRRDLVCRLLLEKKKTKYRAIITKSSIGSSDINVGIVLLTQQVYYVLFTQKRIILLFIRI